jgi:hypothetical protein
MVDLKISLGFKSALLCKAERHIIGVCTVGQSAGVCYVLLNPLKPALEAMLACP